MNFHSSFILPPLCRSPWNVHLLKMKYYSSESTAKNNTVWIGEKQYFIENQ